MVYVDHSYGVSVIDLYFCNAIYQNDRTKYIKILIYAYWK